MSFDCQFLWREAIEDTILQRMIRTFGLGPRVPKRILSRLEKGPSVENECRSQGKCKKQCVGKICGFWVIMGFMNVHVVPKTESVCRPCLWFSFLCLNFSSCHASHTSTTQKTTRHDLTRISLIFHSFLTCKFSRRLMLGYSHLQPTVILPVFGVRRDMCVNTRKTVKYVSVGHSQGKLWWSLRQSDERPIEPSNISFHPNLRSW